MRGAPHASSHQGTEPSLGATQVTVTVKAAADAPKNYQALFLVDTGVTDSMAPACELEKIALARLGRMAYELANGQTVEYDFGVGFIELMGEVPGGRVIFGPDDCDPILGVAALESVGIMVDPVTRTLRRLPAVPLK